MRANKVKRNSIEGSLDTRRKLLEAALAIFAKKGFAAATTREIAAMAGVFQPQISYFFSGKEQLWRAVVDLVFSRFDDLLEGLVADMPPEPADRIALLVRSYVGFAADNPAWASLVVRERAQDSEEGEWLTEKWLRPRSAKIIRILLGRDLSSLSAAELMQAMSLLSILTSAAAPFTETERYRTIACVSPETPEFRDEHIRLITAAMIAGAAAMR